MPDQPSVKHPSIFPWATLALLAISVLLLTLALAPVKQFYLAWIGLVPWLLVVRQARTARAAFLWSWLAGTIFFFANMWWMGYVTVPGMIALMIYLGLYWGIAALIIRGAGLLGKPVHPPPPGTAPTPPVVPPMTLARAPDAVAAILLIPAIWVGLEWLRGTLFTGLPWLYLGHTQTPILPMCQIADITGAYGVSYWVMMVNVLILAGLMGRTAFSRLRLASAIAGALIVVILGYGIFRILQSSEVTRAGPYVAVIQSNFPQSNSGGKGAPTEEIVAFHLQETRRAVASWRVDLAVWSETVLPPINRQSRAFLNAAYPDNVAQEAYADTAGLAAEDHIAILAGGTWTKWKLAPNGQHIVPAETRNSTYLFMPSGQLSTQRYDKVHLVPFGEYTPFKDSCPPLYHFFLMFNPYPDPSQYELTAGKNDAMTVFTLPARRTLLRSAAGGAGTGRFGAGFGGNPTSGPAGLTSGSTGGALPPPATFRFVTPICFEDIDAPLVARMFRPDKTGPRAGLKRADFLVNVTNDGWFKANEMPQHLQAATFRGIENRVPTARAVNTGISGFIDSVGNTTDLAPAGVSAFRTHPLVLDNRITFYTLFGDIFAFACAIVAAALAVIGIYWWRRRRHSAKATAIADSPPPQRLQTTLL